ncbi:hypothetical protein A2U01_0016217 [Trifolium medium]|uniref:Uncharacterized protein n=1 Tax=Trifolium medium TaxID=97028 RepID=A0A392N6M4_9FABA|nr:hypothetical protein [Trifolium medium]
MDSKCIVSKIEGEFATVEGKLSLIAGITIKDSEESKEEIESASTIDHLTIQPVSTIDDIAFVTQDLSASSEHDHEKLANITPMKRSAKSPLPDDVVLA